MYFKTALYVGQPEVNAGGGFLDGLVKAILNFLGSAGRSR
jgi:hypothetical protein